MSDAPRRKVSDVSSPFLTFSAGTAKMIEWRGMDGDTLRGALILPAGYRPGNRYPLILRVYGGRDLSDNLNRFGFAPDAVPIENLQVFASRGYAVLLADSRLGVGTPITDLMKTLLPGVDRAIAIGIADPNRIGVMGASYGGYSTLGLITQSRRFKAAVMRSGFGDLIAAYGQLSPDGSAFFSYHGPNSGQGRIGGTPWEVRDRYIENSPFFYLDRVTTPLLIIQGDDNMAPYLSDQIFVGLRRLGKPAEYARYAGEGHWEGNWRLSNQIDYLTRVVGWFDRYLAPEAPVRSETVP